VVLLSRLEQALIRLNPDVPFEVLDDASRKITHIGEPTLTSSNRIFHWSSPTASPSTASTAEQDTSGDTISDSPTSPTPTNDWLVVNQFTVQEGKNNRPPTSWSSSTASPWPSSSSRTHHRGATTGGLQTDPDLQIPDTALFVTNELLVSSDGMETRIGSLTSEKNGSAPGGPSTVSTSTRQASSPSNPRAGLFQKERLLDYIRYAILFEDTTDQSQRRLPDTINSTPPARPSRRPSRP
jgi:type I restriction enzyme R subunit